MPGLSTKEATRIEESLHLEETLVAKFGAAAGQVSDPECRRILTDIQALHQRHFEILRRQVNAAGSELSAWSGVEQSPSAGGYPATMTGL